MGWTPESWGLEAISGGFLPIYTDDHEQLTAVSIVFHAPYATRQQQLSEVR